MLTKGIKRFTGAVLALLYVVVFITPTLTSAMGYYESGTQITVNVEKGEKLDFYITEGESAEIAFTLDKISDIGINGYNEDTGYLSVKYLGKEYKNGVTGYIQRAVLLPFVDESALEQALVPKKSSPMRQRAAGQIPSPLIVDISQWQAFSDAQYDKIADKIDMVIIRAQISGEENGIDDSFHKHVQEFQKRGVSVHVYFAVYSYSMQEAVLDATKFAERGMKYGAVMYWFDMEFLPGSTLVDEPNITLRQAMSEQVRVLRAKIGSAKIGYYIANHKYDEYNLNTQEVDAIWIPHYGNNTGYYDGIQSTYPHDVHQYTSKGQIDGYDGPLDFNRLTHQRNLDLSWFTTIPTTVGNISDLASVTAGNELNLTAPKVDWGTDTKKSEGWQYRAGESNNWVDFEVNTAVTTEYNGGKLRYFAQGNKTSTAVYSNEVSITVIKNNQAVKIEGGNQTKQIGDPNFTLEVTGAKTPVTWESNHTSVATVNAASGEVSVIGEGVATITVTATEDNSYNKATATVQITVNKKTQEISIEGGNQNKALGDQPFDLQVNGAQTAVSFTSSDTDVATVDSNGKVSLISVGTTTITATAAADAAYEEAEASVQITVSKSVQAISIPEGNQEKTYGDDDFTLTAKDAETAVEWESSDTQVATVDNNGKVTLVAAGTTTIKATAVSTEEYNEATAEITLKVNKKDQTIGISGNPQTTFTYSENVQTEQLTVTGEQTTVQWSVSDENVATVSGTGLLTIKNAGTAIITATAEESTTHKEAKAEIAITVNKADQVITASETTVTKTAGDAAFNIAVNDAKTALNWTSDNEAVATVDENGLITIVGASTTPANIKVQATESDNYNASNEATIALTVNKGTQAISIVGGNQTVEFKKELFTLEADSAQTNVTWTSSDPTVAEVNAETGEVMIMKVGTTTITAKAEETDSFYESNAATMTLTVTQTTQTIEIVDIEDKTYGDEKFALSVKGNKTPVTWAIDPSSDTDVVTIDGSSGEITIIETGTVKVTATATASENYKEASANITFEVQKADQAVTIQGDEEISKILTDGSFALTAEGVKTTPAWSSSDSTVATVDNTGNVEIIGEGTTVIKVEAIESGNYNKGEAQVTLTVAKANQALSILGGDRTVTIEQVPITLIVDGAKTTVTWDSSDETVAEVDNTGKVTIKGDGETTITVTAEADETYNESNATIKLTVTKLEQESLVIEQGNIYTIDLNAVARTRSMGLKISVTGGTTNETLVFTSSDEEVATVDTEGNITALKTGIATITATMPGNNIYRDVEVQMTFNVVSKQIINSNVALTENLLDSVTVGTEVGQYLQSAVDELQKVLDEAKAVKTEEHATQVELDEANTKLYNAILAFQGSVNKKEIVTPGKDNSNGGNNSSESTDNKGAKTGDKTPRVFFLIALILSASGAIFILKKKSKKQ